MRKANPAQRVLAPKPEKAAPTTPTPEQHSRLDSPTDDPIDDSPEPVTYRLSLTQLARFEALTEKLHKLRAVPPGTSREEILRSALEALIASTSEPYTALSPRGESAIPYHIIISECPACKRACVQTNRGPKGIGKSELEAMKCDATIEDEQGRNRRTIPLKTRRAVLNRDQHRCRAPGCTHTHILEIHHIIPREKGGTQRLENLVTLCSTCRRLWHEHGLDGRPLKLSAEAGSCALDRRARVQSG